MDWAAKPIPQSPRTYSSAPAIAMRYRELETRCHERAGRGFDVEESSFDEQFPDMASHRTRTRTRFCS